MAISSPGIGSNLNVTSIVSQLMAVEQQPITLLATQTTADQTILSGYGTLTSALEQFQTSVGALSNISTFQAMSANVANTSVASVTATAAAATGTYALAVTKLAQGEKLVAAGQASESAAISDGVISFSFGTSTTAPAAFTPNGSGIKTITINSTNDSLTGICGAINAANIGVSATLVNDGSNTPYRLSLTVNATGASNSLKISVADAAPGTSTALSTLLNQDPAGSQALTQTVAAQNAEFTLDGIAISKPSNTVSDAIAGVTLNLASISASPTNVSIAPNTAAVVSAVNSFVTAYNTINSTLTDAAAYNKTTGAAASLNGESTVRGITKQIRSVLTNPVAGGASALSVLSQVGVSLQSDGSLVVDSTQLQAALSSNFNGFAGLFAAAGSASDSLVAYSGATNNTQPGAYSVNVTQLATQGKTLATAAAGLNIDSTNDTLQVQLDGVTSTITLNHSSSYTPATLAAEVQSQINGAAGFVTAGSSATVSASAGGVLTITSNSYGSGSSAGISGGDGQANLNFISGAGVGIDTAGTINGMAATGSGQTLTGTTGTPAEGLSLQINGGSIGDRGTVNYSQGYAYQFNTIVTAMVGTNGTITARTNGISASMATIAKNSATMTARLAGIQASYMAQYTALDVTVSSMTATSTFLTQQLAAIAANHP